MPNDIPGFPTISVGGETFFDISHIVTPNRYLRSRTNGLANHHSVTGQHYATMAAEVEHIKAINAYHIQQEYGGFGYNGIVFESGRVYVVGNGLGGRAHVAYRNHELEGLCWVGNFQANNVPLGIILGAARWHVAKFRQHGLKPVRGHREWAVAGWETACPGANGMAAIPIVLRAAVAYASKAA